MNTIPLPFLVKWVQCVDFPRKLGLCDLLFGRSLASAGICWVQTGAGVTWKLDLRNCGDRWIVYGRYQSRAFHGWVRRFLPSGGVIVDSGANIGQMVMFLARLVTRGKVLAFEPGKMAADWLEECLSHYPSLPVELIRHGLGAYPSEAYLKNAGPDYEHGGWSHVSKTKGEPIRIVRLVDELATRSIEKVDFWKLDVEGYELLALQGAESLLKEHRIRAIYVELAGKGAAQVQDYLAAFGYRCYFFSPLGKLRPAYSLPKFSNGLFLPV